MRGWHDGEIRLHKENLLGRLRDVETAVQKLQAAQLIASRCTNRSTNLITRNVLLCSPSWSKGCYWLRFYMFYIHVIHV